MTQEDRKLLLQDLSARMPYGVKIKLGDYAYQVCGYNSEKPLPLKIWYYYGNSSKSLIDVYLEDYHPYLRPMSSMTEEEAKEIAILNDIKDILSVKVTSDYIDVIVDDGVCSTERRTIWYDEIISSIEIFDWLNAHHFDYRGLIEEGLAIAVTEENNPYKE